MIGSLFLAAVGMAEILLSIPCAWFLFKVVFQVQCSQNICFFDIFILIFAFIEAGLINRNKKTESPDIIAIIN